MQAMAGAWRRRRWLGCWLGCWLGLWLGRGQRGCLRSAYAQVRLRASRMGAEWQRCGFHTSPTRRRLCPPDFAAGSSNGPPAAALMSTGGLVRNLMSTHPGLDPAAVMSALGSDRPGSPLIRNSPSQSVMLTGGPSGRGSRATGHNSNSPSMPAAVAAAAAAAAAAGARGGSRNNSFSVGGGGPANMSRMGAGGLASGPMPAGGVGSTTLTAALAVARGSGGGSPHPSPHHSPHHSGTGTAGGAGCSPRSPLGMRTRRASDTMAYTISLTERQESFTQMQAQVGIGLAARFGFTCSGRLCLQSAIEP